MWLQILMLRVTPPGSFTDEIDMSRFPGDFIPPLALLQRVDLIVIGKRKLGRMEKLLST